MLHHLHANTNNGTALVGGRAAELALGYRQYGLAYSSIRGRGKSVIVEDVEEKMQAMTFLMKRNQYKSGSKAIWGGGLDEKKRSTAHLKAEADTSSRRRILNTWK